VVVWTGVSGRMLTPMQSFVSVVKAAIGAGSFILPYSMTSVSLSLALPLTLFMGFLSCYTICLLLRCDSMVAGRKNKATDAIHGSPSSRLDNVSSHLQSSESSSQAVDDTGIELSELTADGAAERNNKQQRHGDNQGNSHHESAETEHHGHLSYAALAAAIFPEWNYNCGRELADATDRSDVTTRNVLGDAVSVGIIFTVVGVGSAYVDFISSTLPILLGNYWGSEDSGDKSVMSAKEITLLLCPILLLLSLVRDFRLLAMTSIIGDIAVLSACVTVLVYGTIQYFRNDNNGQPHTNRHDFNGAAYGFQTEHMLAVTDTNSTLSIPAVLDLFATSTTELLHIPAYLGDLTFLFGIHIVAFPILQQSCDALLRPKANSTVAMYVYMFLSVFNCIFGCIGAMLYQRVACAETGTVGPCANVLNNLSGSGSDPSSSAVIVDLVKLMICVDLFFTLPIVISAATEIIEPEVLGLLGHNAGNDRHSAAAITSSGAAEGQTDSSSRATYSRLHTTDVGDAGSGSMNAAPVPSATLAPRLAAGKCKAFVQFVSKYLDMNRMIRMVTVLVVVLCSLSIPNFDAMVSLTGGAVCSVTGYILPPLLYVRVMDTAMEAREDIHGTAQLERHARSPRLYTRVENGDMTVATNRAPQEGGERAIDMQSQPFIAGQTAWKAPYYGIVVFGMFVMVSNILAFFGVI
jgi:hypothetical protein